VRLNMESTPLGPYQGVTEQVVMSRTPGERSSFHAVLQNQNGRRENCMNCMSKKIRKSMKVAEQKDRP